jgi:hypothetical protein
MAGKGRMTVLILVIAALVVAGCSSPPLGIIGEGLSSPRTFEGLLVKYKSLYKQGEFFKWEDLTVTILSRDGEMGQTVIPTDIRIKGLTDTGQPESVDKTDGYELTTAGEKIVMVRYENLSSQYYITVTEESTAVTSQPSGIIVVWANP